ncbi:MAG: ABC transporter substrate-binding protein [Candidatus Rokubacteria bacterium]|nr:ABC transporter substrate-binding protein [Candidatus Rokubacteria bacterium]
MRYASGGVALVLALLTAGLGPRDASAAGTYDPGASDTEIKIGNTMPYSGPASSYGTIGRAIASYLKMINDQGGIRGRKLNFISLDDGYSPPKTVEQVRRLVENEQVLFLFSTVGTPTNTAVWKYLNDRKIPQLFVATGASKWGDPVGHPWTMGFQPPYAAEGRIYAQYVREHIPNAKIGVLYQNDDYGKDYVRGFKEGLGPDGQKLIASEQTYEVSDPTVDSQIVNLKNSGANVFFDVTIARFSVQAIRKAHAIGWKPVHFLNYVSAVIAVVLKPAGLEASTGTITAAWLKDPDDPEWSHDGAILAWREWMQKYYPEGNPRDISNVYGYTVAETMVHVLRQCGDDLTRANVMRQAANIKKLALPLLLPGVTVDTSPTDFYPVEHEQLSRFDGERWVRFGPIYDAGRAR